MASSAKTKVYDSKSLKTIRMKSFSDNFTVETDDEARISLWSVVNISSDYTSFFSWIEEESWHLSAQKKC